MSQESASATSNPTSESLFDTNFTENPIDSGVLPTSDNQTAAIIGYRILVSVKEAGIIIGKNGSVIANVRETTGVKAGVSQVIPGCADRVLTVTGPVDAVSHALCLIASALLTSPIDDSSFQHFPLKRLLPYASEGHQSLRLLVPNAQMGTIIGKQGTRIKALQQNHDVKIVASKDFLHSSTERLVELQGKPKSIEEATKVLSRCLIEDWHSATGATFYSPTPRTYTSTQSRNYRGNQNYSSNNTSNSESITRTVNYPSDMVGCLIGKGGSRVQEIRKVSGAQINIASEDDQDGKRAFILSGPSRSVEKAISFLTQNLEREQERRERLNSGLNE